MSWNVLIPFGSSSGKNTSYQGYQIATNIKIFFSQDAC